VTVLRAWWALLVLDLSQVALRAPGAITVRGAAWLAALYAVVVVGLGVVWAVLRRLAGRRRRVPRRHPSLPALVGMAVLLVVAVAAATRGTGDRETAASRPTASNGAHPNILLVVIDTLRADHLGSYGYARPTTPTIDAVAARGTLFAHAYALSSWTKPSTASLVTGRSPTEHQTLSEEARLPDSEVTIAERLRAAGYRTALLSGNPWVTPEYGFGQGVDDYFSAYDERFARVTLLMQALRRLSDLSGGRIRFYNRVKYLVLGELSTTARDTILVDEALRWLAAPVPQPFFLYVHMMSPHHPYDPPPPFDRFVPDRTHAPVKNYPRKSYRFFEGGEPLDGAALTDMIARYDGDVLYADTELGRLLAGLDRLGLASTTAVLVTADHGEEFFEHGNWGHGQSVYNELIRVPLVLRLPDGGGAGRQVTTPVSHADVVPTLLAIAGAPPAPALVGRSLLATGEGSDVVSELLYRYGESRALVRDRRKLVVTHQGERRQTGLFDLDADPGEHDPRPADAALATALDERVQAEMRARSAATDAPVDEETRRRLRALGYGN
jgi:arylsulfatase A-like enzyme